MYSAYIHMLRSSAMFGLCVTTRAGGHLLSSWNGKLGRSLTKTSTLRQGRIVFVLAISTRITFAWIYNNKACRRDADDAFEEARAWRIFSSFAIHMCSLLGRIERLQKHMTPLRCISIAVVQHALCKHARENIKISDHMYVFGWIQGPRMKSTLDKVKSK